MSEKDKEMMAKLQEPFPPEDIEWRVGATTQDKKKGMAIAYITNRALQSRLDELFGPAGWRNEYKEWKSAKSQLCGISIKFGDEWITKWDGADDSEHEPTKGGLSDAMKRAGYQWGIGRYLYNLENVWVPIEPAGKSHKFVTAPKLPDWALPAGYKPQKNERPAATTRTEAPVPEAAATETPNVTKPDNAQKQALQIQYKMGNGGKVDGFDSWFTKCLDKGYSFPKMKKLLDSAADKKAKPAATGAPDIKAVTGF